MRHFQRQQCNSRLFFLLVASMTSDLDSIDEVVVIERTVRLVFDRLDV
jgi:hypothetical protein